MLPKLRVMLLVSHYLPGHRAGGPICSIANLVQALGDEIDFRIVTSDRDLGSDQPYRDVVADVWVAAGKAKIIYLSPSGQLPHNLARLLQQSGYDVLYLNSFFERSFSILPLWLHNMGLTRAVPILLAPRGEFAPSALSIKSGRKWLYMHLAFSLRQYRRVIWHASSEFEREDILQVLPRPHERAVLIPGPVPGDIDLNRFVKAPRRVAVLEAPDLVASCRPVPEIAHQSTKQPGDLRLVFLARIARMKNLGSALLYLNGLRGNITFDIYGPLEDPLYWRECQALIDQLPATIEVNNCGAVSHERVFGILAQYDLFLLPTMGENFGHSIAEAMAASCPVLISDRTPWRNLEQAHAGFDVPLEQPARFREVLQLFVDMDESTHRQWRAGAYAYALQMSRSTEALEQNRRLFATMAALADKGTAMTARS